MNQSKPIVKPTMNRHILTIFNSNWSILNRGFNMINDTILIPEFYFLSFKIHTFNMPT